MNSSLPAPKANMTMAAYWAIISTHVSTVSSPIVVTHPVVTATVTSAPTVSSAPLMSAPTVTTDSRPWFMEPIVVRFKQPDDYDERYADYKEQLRWEQHH